MADVPFADTFVLEKSPGPRWSTGRIVADFDERKLGRLYVADLVGL